MTDVQVEQLEWCENHYCVKLAHPDESYVHLVLTWLGYLPMTDDMLDDMFPMGTDS